MNKRKLIIIISSIIALIFFTSVAYRCIKNYCTTRDETELYQKGLQPNIDKDNPFASKVQLSFYDSMLANPRISISQYNLTQYYKAVTLIKLGKEKRCY